MITTLIKNLADGFAAGKDIYLEEPFSFLDSPDAAYTYLGQAAANIDGNTCSAYAVVVTPNNDNDEECARRYIKDISPYIILDKMLAEYSGALSVNFNKHTSLQKVLCCLQLVKLVNDCTCPDNAHEEVFPIPVTWYDPDTHTDLDEDHKKSEKQKLFNDLAVAFGNQVDSFNTQHPLSTHIKDEMNVFEMHLREVLGNCEHARKDGKYGDLGFCGFLAHRHGKMICNLSIITIGQTIQESEIAKSGQEFQLIFEVDGIETNASAAAPLLEILGLNDEQQLASRRKRGGLYNFYATSGALSSNLDLAIASGDICFVHKEGEDNNPKRTVHLNRRHIPGTVISSRFEVEL